MTQGTTPERGDALSVLRKTLILTAVVWTAWRLWRHSSLAGMDGPAKVEAIATSKDPEVVAALDRLSARLRLLIT